MKIFLNLPSKYNRILTVIAFLFWGYVSAVHIMEQHRLYVWQMEGDAFEERIANIGRFQQAIQDGNTDGVQTAIKAGFDVNEKEIIYDDTHFGAELIEIGKRRRTMLTLAKFTISCEEWDIKSDTFAHELSPEEKHLFLEKYEAHKAIAGLLIKAGAREGGG